MSLQFNQSDFTVSYAGEVILLLPKEYALLHYLAEHPNQAFTRDDLLDRVWPLEDVTDRTVDDHIYRLRKKLKRWGHRLTLDTIRGHGYRLHVKAQPSAAYPSLHDQELWESMEKVLHRFHLFGQGEAMLLLASQQQALGLQFPAAYRLQFLIETGNIRGVLETDRFSFGQKAYVLLHQYYLLDFDGEPSLRLYQRALEQDPFLFPWQYREFYHLSLVHVLIQTGRVEQALERLQETWALVKREEMHGFVTPVTLAEFYAYFRAGDDLRAEAKLQAVEEQLRQHPYLRETGAYHIAKGLWLLRQGQRQEARRQFTEGLDILRQSKFFSALLYGFHHLIYYLNHSFDDADLAAMFNKQWAKLKADYELEELRPQIERLLEANLFPN
ncbi:MAG TPA: winged helix-turn-helix domain-containing protein [Bacilli bacterium]|nr:winged helix-turn-helix domain-containing protein [Bacilli bacterium]